MDISAYHPSIIANLLNYTFDSSDIHGSFAKMYGVDYAKAKEITFKQIYGGVWKEYQELPFFKKVIAYTDDLTGCDPNIRMNYKHTSCDEIIGQNKK